MPHWRTMIEKDHLGAWDLTGPDGKTPRDYTLQIVKVQSVSLKTREVPKGKRKLVITFAKARKKFVCNTTNAETLEDLYGGDVDQWVGKLVTLYQTDVRSPKGKGMVKGIRVRPRRPEGQAEEVPDKEVDEDIRSDQNDGFGREPGSDDE